MLVITFTNIIVEKRRKKNFTHNVIPYIQVFLENNFKILTFGKLNKYLKKIKLPITELLPNIKENIDLRTEGSD